VDMVQGRPFLVNPAPQPSPDVPVM
jgi:hypothetical protein